MNQGTWQSLVVWAESLDSCEQFGVLMTLGSSDLRVWQGKQVKTPKTLFQPTLIPNYCPEIFLSLSVITFSSIVPSLSLLLLSPSGLWWGEMLGTSLLC